MKDSDEAARVERADRIKAAEAKMERMRDATRKKFEDLGFDDDDLKVLGLGRMK